MLDQLKGVDLLNNIDLKSSYHKVSIMPTDVWKITFKCKQGPFDGSVMPFQGLTNALTIFMGMLDYILQAFTNSFIFIPGQHHHLPQNLGRSYEAHSTSVKNHVATQAICQPQEFLIPHVQNSISMVHCK
jgi:hypothetical protein